MNTIALMAPLLSGLGFFFIGVRSLSASLVPLVGRRARNLFANALRGPFSTPLSGIAAGLLTQSSTAVSWIVLGFVRTGLAPGTWVLLAPTWSNVGTALLPILVAINLTTPTSYVIGIARFVTYLRLDNTDRRRNAVAAALGAGMLLFGMDIVSGVVPPMRVALEAQDGFAAFIKSPYALALIGGLFSLVTQSSSVGKALAVGSVTNGLIPLEGALPLIAGANAAGVINNFTKASSEAYAGRLVFLLQVLQKAGGTLLLLGLIGVGYAVPQMITVLESHGHRAASQEIASIFTSAQSGGAIIASILAASLAAWERRRKPPNDEETLGVPIFLLHEAPNDPPVALNLTQRELARLAERLPMMLEHVRRDGDQNVLPATTLGTTGVALAASIRQYLLGLVDQRPGRESVAAALLLENAAGNAGGLNEALSELVAAAPAAQDSASAVRLIESLHMLMGLVGEYAATLGAEDPSFVLRLLGDRSAMMADLRKRMMVSVDVPAETQDSLFKMTILFERCVWLARRLVTDSSQAQAIIAPKT